MRTVNKVILIWNITKDPFVKTTDWGKKVALFTIATNRFFKNLKWEVKSESEFTNCVAWWNLAERCEVHLKKWKLVYAEWRLKTKITDREDGIRTFKTEIVIGNLIFLNKRSEFEEKEIDATAISPDIIDEEIDLDDDNKF